MGDIQFALKDAVCTYTVTPQIDDRFERHTPICNNSLVINHTAKTNVLVQCGNSREIVIIGYCVDAHGKIPQREVPAAFLTQNFADPLSAYRYFDRFAGAFVVLYRMDDQLFMWGDAMCSLPINYCMSDGKFYAALTDKLLADILSLQISDVSLRIRKGSSIYSQPLPNDLTMYDQIKALLPNHYLNCNTCEAIRVPLNVSETAKQEEIERIIEYTADLADNIAKIYGQDFELALPLTAGTDSRAILSFYKKVQPALPCFTFKHADFTDATADIAVPTKICQMLHLPYQAIPDEMAPHAWTNGIAAEMHPYLDESEVNNVYTYRVHMNGKANADGSIIDEVGKSTQENAVPAMLINVPYMMCKLHNYEKSAKTEVKKYIDEIERYGEREHIADLFAMEQKLGRRVSQASVMYSLCGIMYLNLFNCREIILQWARIPRKIRVKKYIPYEFLRRNDADLLKIPFNPGSKSVTLAKKFWPIFYIATFLKYYFMKARIPGSQREL